MSQIKVDSIIPRGGLPGGASGGGIIQMVSTTKTDQFSTSSFSWIDITGLSVNITPQSSSHKIMVSYSVGVSARANVYSAGIRLMRDSTAIFIGDEIHGASERRASNWIFTSNDAYSDRGQWPCNGTYLDSPNSTSQQTYKLQIITGYDGNDVNVNGARGGDNQTWSGSVASTITVMEVSV
tara:strand:- start:126 stop:668 length:543 start_codon:yes stop_codon:yes gene_type:complete